MFKDNHIKIELKKIRRECFGASSSWKGLLYATIANEYSNPNSVQEFSFTQRPQRKEAQSSTETNLFATFAKNSATFA